jgi:hypothetical protein
VTVTKADRGRAYLAERLNGGEVDSKTLKRELNERFGIGAREATRLADDMELTIRIEAQAVVG